MTSTHRILRNFGLGAAGYIVSQFVLFIAFAYLARTLEPAGFGAINFAIAFVTYFTIMATLGLPTLGMREIARSRDETSAITGNIVLLQMLLAAGAYILLATSLLYMGLSVVLHRLVLLCGLMLFLRAVRLDWVFAGLENMGVSALGKIINAAVLVGMAVLLVRTPEDLSWSPVPFLCGAFAGSGALLVWHLRVYGISWNIPRLELKKLLRASVPLAFSMFMIQLYYNIDSVLLGFIRDYKEVGYYNAAYRIILFFSGFVGLYVHALFPVIARAYEKDKSWLAPFLSKALDLTLVIVVPFGVGGVVVSAGLVDMLYGPEYSESVLLVQILIWSTVIVAVSVLYGNSLLACDGERSYAVGVTIGAVLNCILNILLIPRHGALAAAGTTVVSEAAVLVYMIICLEKRVGRVKLEQARFWRIVVASGIMGWLVLQFSRELPILLTIGMGISVYFVAMFLIKGITVQEIRAIWKILQADSIH